MLRKKGVVDKFVEFHGPGLSAMTIADRATIANMSPEYGATMGFFPVDAETLRYLERTNRTADARRLEAYAEAQGLFRTDEMFYPSYTDTLSLDLATVEPCLAGPKRPQDRVALREMKSAFRQSLVAPVKERGYGLGEGDLGRTVDVGTNGDRAKLGHGSVVIAAITSCTNTSNPSVMVAAGLLAKKAVERGLTRPPHVKTSMAPGSKVVTEYLKEAGLMAPLEALGFDTVGYGCTTCIGNSGPLPEPIATAVTEGKLVAAAVLSGNRNFEGRINPHTRANYLASPPLVVAYALAGTVDIDMERDPLGTGKDGKPVYLKDLWPTQPRDRGHHRHGAPAGPVPRPVRQCVRRQPPLERHPGGRRRPLQVGRAVDLHPRAAVLRQPRARGDAGARREECSRARHGRRLGDHRPHLAGR